MPASGRYTGEVERLAALLSEQAAGESEQCLAAAREQAERTRASAQAEAEAIRSAAEREGEARGRRRAAELVAVARAQRQMRLLQVREALIEAALTQARAQLAGLAALPAAAETLAALIGEGLPLFPPGPVRVQIGERDAALLDARLRSALGAGRWTLRVEPAAVAGGGVILESDDGRLRFDNSLDARGRRRRDRLRRLAASILLLDTKEASGQP